MERDTHSDGKTDSSNQLVRAYIKVLRHCYLSNLLPLLPLLHMKKPLINRLHQVHDMNSK